MGVGQRPRRRRPTPVTPSRGPAPGGFWPPRPECAPTWQRPVLAHLGRIRLTLLIGRYAQEWHLNRKPGSLTETVRDWQSFGPTVMPLPHPSGRNNIWLSKNPWFAEQLLPEVRRRVASALAISDANV